MSDELFPPESVAMDSPRIAWMKRHRIVTWFNEGTPDMIVPPQWFAGYDYWWPGRNGEDFFAMEMVNNGCSRIGQGDTEHEALIDFAARWDLPVWNQQDR